MITSVAAMPERWNKGGEQSTATAIGRPAENAADMNRPYNGDISHADGLALTEVSYELCCILITGFFPTLQAVASVQGSFSAMRLSHNCNPAPVEKVCYVNVYRSCSIMCILIFFIRASKLRVCANFGAGTPLCF